MSLAASYLVDDLKIAIRKSIGEQRVIDDPRVSQKSRDFAITQKDGMDRRIVDLLGALDRWGALDDFGLFLAAKARG